MRLGRLFVGLMLAVVSTCVSLLLLEVGARLYDRSNPEPAGREQYARARTPPFATADYFGDEFIREASSQEPKPREDAPGGVALREFRGRFINVRDGRRVTTDQPAAYEHTIHVFGGSTLFCGEVPDRWTIPSLLQRLSLERYGTRFRFINQGIPGFTARDQVRLLQTVDVRREDYVVFYDGTNEVYHSIFYGHADPEVARLREDGRSNWSTTEHATYFIWKKLRKTSTFVRRFCDVTRNRRWSEPPHVRDRARLQPLLEATARDYRAALLAGQEWSRGRGAKFLHFLQPTIFTLRHPSEFERQLIANHNLIFAGLETAHREGYVALASVQQELQANMQTFDLRDALDLRRPGAEFFIDDCHVTHAANELVAQRMFAALMPVLDRAGQ